MKNMVGDEIDVLRILNLNSSNHHYLIANWGKMYISRIKINGFRNFIDTDIIFNDGVNVVIGHNNAGKSNLLKALSLVIDSQSPKRLGVDDFNKHTTLKNLQDSPPRIIIELSIAESENDDPDDLATIGNWLTTLETPYQALLTYSFFLPEKEVEKYKKALASVTEKEKAWEIIREDFIRLYVYRIFGGEAKLQNPADSESLQKFDFQFLNAIRDVERDMFTGRNTLLKDVLDFFIDYEIKNDAVKTSDDKEAEIKRRKADFKVSADKLLDELQQRMDKGKKQILSYAEETGASFNKANPNFEGSVSDTEMFSALKLIVEYETGIKIPATHNGLGYNNLIFMSLLLSKMQVNSNGAYLGSNAKVFPVLAIEEPEAHLHPAMQYKFLKFLMENQEASKKVRQVFVTTHSTQITSAVSLDEIICLHVENDKVTIGYPGKVFPNDNSGEKSKAYVQRFLDATKSDMLFAQKVILVEGLAEQLLLSVMAQYLGKSLEDNHIAVINVGGRTFDYFLKLFDGSKPHTIPKKIACLADRDPERKKKTGRSYERCYPFEFNHNLSEYDYQENAKARIEQFSAHSNIRFFSQDVEKGKTFEYDLALHNPVSKLLISERLKNRDEITELMACYEGKKPITDYVNELRESDPNMRIIDSITENTTWSEDDKKKAIIAARYLNSVGKGENALDLSYRLEENLKTKSPESFNVPTYIKEAIEWICT